MRTILAREHSHFWLSAARERHGELDLKRLVGREEGNLNCLLHSTLLAEEVRPEQESHVVKLNSAPFAER